MRSTKLLAVAALLAVTGCGDPLGKIQSKAEDKLDQALQMANEQGTRAFQYSGNIQVNRPGYRATGIVKFGSFAEFDAVVYLEGVAGAASLSGQGDDETESSPHAKEQATSRPTP